MSWSHLGKLPHAIYFHKLFLTAPHDVEFYSITMLSEWPRDLLLIFAVYAVYAMEPNKSEESGEMYSPDDQGE